MKLNHLFEAIRPFKARLDMSPEQIAYMQSVHDKAVAREPLLDEPSQSNAEKLARESEPEELSAEEASKLLNLLISQESKSEELSAEEDKKIKITPKPKPRIRITPKPKPKPPHNPPQQT
jgi:hypothetical protein